MAKLYYKISEVAEILNEPVSAVRFWANSFPRYVKPERNAKGDRLFHPKDVESLKLIHYLVKEKGLTLDGAAARLAENKSGLDRQVEIVEKLKRIRKMLTEIQEEV